MANPPARAQLFWKLLTPSELLLLLAMLENSGGRLGTIWPSIERLAAYTKLDARTVQRLIHGYIDPRTGERRQGFLERAILSEIHPGSGVRHKTATYHLNLEALFDDPKMARYMNYQQQLHGIPRRPINGEPLEPVTPCHQGGDTVTGIRVTPWHPPGDTVSPDSKAFDSISIDSQTMIRASAVSCTRCGGLGMRNSYSKPGKRVMCECTEEATEYPV